MAAKKQSCGALIYDILGQIISILDVVTDIIVCIQYYQNDRMVFFGISITILILALIAYDTLFMIQYNGEDTYVKIFALFLVILPFSPLIPFVLYLSTDPESRFSKMLKYICCFEIDIENRIDYIDKDNSKLRQFMYEKFIKHSGFIVESLVEGIAYILMYSSYPCTFMSSLFYHQTNSISSSNSANGGNCNLQRSKYNCNYIHININVICSQ